MTSSDDTCIYQAWGNLTCSSANKNKKSVEMFMDGSRMWVTTTRNTHVLVKTQ